MGCCAARANGPAWSDQLIERHLDILRELLPEDWLPRMSRSGEMQEYGCGSWGCVYPANDDRVVFKLTTDETEARFVATAARLPKPEGIVRYEWIAQLDGMAVAPGDERDRKLRNVYALVRESAEGIGDFKVQEGESGGDVEQRRRASLGLRLFREAADFIRQAVSFQGPEILAQAARVLRHGTTALTLVRADELYGPAWLRAQSLNPQDPVIVVPSEADADELVAKMHQLAVDSASAIASLPDMELLGEAMSHYLDLGLLLCDVHLKNVGKAQRYGRWEWVITDPGHLVRLRDDIPDVMPRHIRDLAA